MNMIDVLRDAGADIALRYDHTIIIKPKELSKHLSGTVIGDYIVSGTLTIIGALTAKDYIDIHDARIEDLSAFLTSIEKMGAKFEKRDNDTLRVYRSKKLKATNIQTNIYPGFPTDMQAQFMALATQANGTSTIDERLFENRFMHVSELLRMGADIQLNGNIATIIGEKGKLSGTDVMATDLRASSALVLAALVAQGETNIHRIYHLDRGYEDLEGKFLKIGANIQRCKEK